MKRSVRKLLAVALAVAMAFSLVTVASAATTAPTKYQDYTDASSIKQKEAVDVLTGIGVLNGIDGAFKPADNVTREQAAKIICYLLIGATAADSLKTQTSSFTDVDPSRWSAGCIQYCASKGIINGLGDGTFNPEGNVTGSQFAKMLLTALGYGKLGEYVGPNWEVNAIADAQRLGILTLDVDCSAPATREQIAQYAFNALTEVDVVVFSKDTENYVTANAAKPTLAAQKGITNNKDTSSTLIDGQLCYQWFDKNGNKLTGNWWPSSDYKVLGTNTTGSHLVNYLSNPSSSSYIASKDDHVKYFKNGTALNTQYGDDSTPWGDEAAGLTAFLNATAGKTGATIKLIDTDADGKYDIASATVWDGAVKLAAAPTVSASGYVTVPGTSISNVDKKNVNGYAGLAAGDVILWYKDNASGVYYIQKCTPVHGQMTSGSPFMCTFGGKFYFASGFAIAGYDLATFVASPSNFNVDATAYVDSYGNIVYITADTATAAKTYGLVLGYQHYGSLSNSASLRLLKQDGTIGVYSQAPEADGIVKDYTTTFAVGSAPYFALVSYTMTSDGKAYITPVAATNRTLSADYNGGSSAITLTTDGTKYISSSTKVFYFDTTKAYSDTNKGSVTTGYANTIDAANGTNVWYVYAPNSTTVLDAIVISSTGSVYASSNFAYTPCGAVGSAKVVNGTTYYDVSVYVNGQMTTLTTTNAYLFASPGLYSYVTNAAGYVTNAYNTTAYKVYKPTLAYYGDITYVDPAGSYFVFEDDASATKAITTNSSTKYYLVDNEASSFPFNSVTAGAIGQSTANVHYQLLYWTTDASGVATQVYYKYYVGDAYMKMSLDSTITGTLEATYNSGMFGDGYDVRATVNTAETSVIFDYAATANQTVPTTGYTVQKWDGDSWENDATSTVSVASNEITLTPSSNAAGDMFKFAVTVTEALGGRTLPVTYTVYVTFTA